MAIKVGDIVNVTPSLPKAKGRGWGVVTRVGETLVRVRFDGARTKAERDGMACWKRDCECTL